MKNMASATVPNGKSSLMGKRQSGKGMGSNANVIPEPDGSIG